MVVLADRREFAGPQMGENRSTSLIRIGAGTPIAALLVRPRVPRRRLSAKITPTRTHLAGEASYQVDLRREMAEPARRAGAESDEVEGHKSDG